MVVWDVLCDLIQVLRPDLRQGVASQDEVRPILWFGLAEEAGADHVVLVESSQESCPLMFTFGLIP